MKRFAILLAVLLSLPSFAADKRRSVGLPDLGSGAATVNVNGTVTDAVTGVPVAFARVTVGKRYVFASRFGTFSLKAVPTSGDVEATASRTGYQGSTVRLSGTGTHEINFRLQGRPAVALRKTDGTILALDDDSLKFGYIVPFMNYQTATGNDFCMTNGTQARIPRAEMLRITPMGTSVPGSCCQRPGQRVLLELRDGTLHDATFIDSCWGYTMDLIAIDHVTGEAVFVPFGEVSEIAFP